MENKKQELEIARKNKQETEQNLSSASTELHSLASRENLSEHEHKEMSNLELAEGKLRKANDDLRSLRQSGANSLNVYSSHMSEMLREIDGMYSARRFAGDKPIGPIGMS